MNKVTIRNIAEGLSLEKIECCNAFLYNDTLIEKRL